ncbi:bifunctional [glutamate--ammonia ligase]-adenylyl-L-tyrosine phosphorylase/[glutamate--ammonia-ligase] adenylyltransferase [Desulfobotulus sp. H1]|uniref:Bifunctional [glutamate--ammonia ligase]-adenylyl-L-tyrosine phosphorylase/[glutamate--ammonia-ligase] adenylyltransferase n=1 Tax=Desulfobotulus pelophilus TaxID=2823377 RepID=A0ABT3NBJ2_9BACT|nr:bifunctional [glutamate--ammonia ligase]-adenylyl-L-tyrosine phosphorylase/[glutamate--ammonia-ligase] adenylyltransferase [Desulfobotulus pelophilus]MCW7754837.1 bifunctional [glutamate--ammonia ligase]-adenylyl-L-tyrosine phosphorylase/[glutamate--ammonia-ligase] adenylyltransferase [Desulfobotulus pelophilus]
MTEEMQTPVPLISVELLDLLAQRHPDTLALLDAASGSLPDGLGDDLRRVAAMSDFFARGLLRDPDTLGELMDGGGLTAFPGPARERVFAALQTVDSESLLSLCLRKIRHLSMMGICFRDLSGRASLGETMASLSELAEAVVDGAASYLHAKMASLYGEPVGEESGKCQRLVVLAMGKLGAGELNFSSDIDLIYAYPEPGETRGPDIITNETFFTRLARKLTAVFSGNTGGPLFRVDLRLRPFGENGPMVMHFDAMEFYYQTQGREWERYALIKCRPVSGNEDDARELMESLKPFVFRRYLDFGVFDSLREMKQSIMLEIRKKGMENNIKTGSGGIREVEFFGQAFQLLRGGVVPGLQQREILKILKTLVRFRFIPPETRENLTNAYVFLRHTEHRIQAWEDRQTHLLPKEDVPQKALAAAMGFENWGLFMADLEGHRQRVHAHFRKLLTVDDESRESVRPMVALWTQPHMDTDRAEGLLAQVGYRDPSAAIRMLGYFRDSLQAQAMSSQGKRRLDTLMPFLLESCARGENPAQALGRILDLLKAIQRRSTYLALFLEYPSALDHLVRLANASPWIMDFLSRHPVLLDELLDPRTLYRPPVRGELVEDLRRRMEELDPEDLETRLENLCVFKQSGLLRVAAADVTGEFPLMKVSDRLTEIAECVVNEIVDFSHRNLVQRHGRPLDIHEKPMEGWGFAVIAYGKLGGLELGYGSDLDLVFLHEDTEGMTEGGEKPLLSSQFFTRLGQRVIHCLKAHTRAGTLYETDLRLRPDGNTGILVVPVAAFADYQRRQAWTWEHQALVRARPVCGNHRMAERFEAVRREVLCLKRESGPLRTEIVNMREKLRSAHARPEPGIFDLKQDPGGIMDIEFLVQYMVLAHAHDTPAITRWTDNIRILETLSETGVMRPEEATFLRSAYLLFRVAVHRKNLQNQPSRVPEFRFEKLREGVRHIWQRYMGTDHSAPGKN